MKKLTCIKLTVVQCNYNIIGFTYNIHVENKYTNKISN